MLEPAPLIAIVEDDASVRRALDRVLRQEGFACTTFERAEELLEYARLPEYACVLADVWLPGMSGLDLLTSLRKKQAGLPVVVMSADDSDEIRDRAERAGAAAFLRKPFDTREMIDALHGLTRSGGEPFPATPRWKNPSIA